ncbi:retrovirus-related Pol polyprotein from transposon 412 [Trichonephila clavipes]|nr:retrovirus-related Pol polyprotein from transposon 412 [Trichonephila clavipes]
MPVQLWKGPKIRSRGKLHRYNVGAPLRTYRFRYPGTLCQGLCLAIRYLLVVMDYFTKWPEVYPIPDQEAPTVAEGRSAALDIEIRGTSSTSFRSGRNFVSAVLKGVCELLELTRPRPHLAPTVRWHGERFNRTILNNLSLMVSKNQQDRDQKSSSFLPVYRSAVHETTGIFTIPDAFGRDLRLPL